MPRKRKAADGKSKSMRGNKKNTRSRETNDFKSKSHISALLEQMREPLGLLETLKEEGIARASYLMGVAAHMAGSVTKENVKTQAQEIVKTLGLVRREEFEALKKKVAVLEREAAIGKDSKLEEE